MSLYDFSFSDKVLFVGEGNFSFSCSLLKILKEKFNITAFCNVIATAYQDELSPSSSVNSNFLKNLGAEVLLGIDATKLEVSCKISSLKFHKIIFNFPHVGGKMKINLNRELLRNFFISASNMLEPGGHVIVTLCSGQGGTGFETNSRRWDDTWQIIEQASYGSFVLFDVQYFPNSLFKDYQPIGFRGREQMFNTESAVTHAFHKVNPPLNNLTDTDLQFIRNYHLLYEKSDILVSLAHKLTFENSPFKNDSSPQKYILDILIHYFKVYSQNNSVMLDELPFTTKFDDSLAPCIFRGKEASLRSSLAQVTPDIDNDFFVRGLVFQKCSIDFKNPCASCQCLVKSQRHFDLIQEYVSKMSLLFNYSGTIHYESDDKFWNAYFATDTVPKSKIIWVDLSSGLVSFDLDMICSFMFQCSVQELWTENVLFDCSKKKIIFPSLYPLEFKFDVCFASQEDLDYEKFYNILHQIPDKLIQSVDLLSIYKPEGCIEKSYCFRLLYKSYCKPLHRKRVIEIHQNVIGTILEKVLNVRIH